MSEDMINGLSKCLWLHSFSFSAIWTINKNTCGCPGPGQRAMEYPSILSPDQKDFKAGAYSRVTFSTRIFQSALQLRVVVPVHLIYQNGLVFHSLIQPHCRSHDASLHLEHPMARSTTAQLPAGKKPSCFCLFLNSSLFQSELMWFSHLGECLVFSRGLCISLLFSYYLLVTLSKLKGKGVMKCQELKLIFSTNSMLSSVFNTVKREQC